MWIQSTVRVRGQQETNRKKCMEKNKQKKNRRGKKGNMNEKFL